MVTAYLLAAFLSVLICVFNYRAGLFLMILIALLGDPVRKLVAGNPVYLSVVFLSIFLTAYFKACFSGKIGRRFFVLYPQMRIFLIAFLFFLVIAAVNRILEVPAQWPLVAYSFAQYVMIILAVHAGYYFCGKSQDLIKMLKTYLILLTPFMISVIPHFAGYQTQWPILNTMGFLDQAYVHHHGGQEVKMLNGLFRGPEIMGWHAMVSCVGSSFLLMATRKKGQRGLLIIYTLLSFFCILASGRRKMLLGAVLCLALFILWVTRRNLKRAFFFLCILALLGGGGFYYLQQQEGAQVYIGAGKSGVEALWERMEQSLITPLERMKGRWAIVGQLGIATQGGRHLLNAESDGIAETGTAKLLFELGVGGTVAGMALMAALIMVFRARLSMIKTLLTPTQHLIYPFLASLCIIHAGSFVVSHQVYADPFIGLVTGMTLGALLAVPKFCHADLVKKKKLNTGGRCSNAPGRINRS